MSRVKDMTQGSPYRLLLLFALPLMAGNVFQQLYTVTDTAIVGRALGVSALAALGATEWFNWCALGSVQGMTQGFAIPIAQEFGAKNYQNMKKVICNAVMLSLICGLFMTIVLQMLVMPVFHLLDTPQEVIEIAERYQRIYFAGIPVMVVYNMTAAILRALGDSKTPLISMVIASVLNIVLDLVFVLRFQWGVAGAAFATVLAQVFASAFCLIKMHSLPILKTDKDFWKRDMRICRKLIALAMPMAFQNGIIAIGGMAVQKVVNQCGVSFIAGYTATNKLYGVLESAGVSYGYGMTTYVGQNVGAAKSKRVSEGIRAGLVIGVITSTVITVLMFVFGRTILSCFIDMNASNGAQALEVGVRSLRIMSAFLSILYILHVVRSTIQGMGNTMIPMISGIAELLMRIGGSLILPVYLGNSGILLIEVIAWIGADIILVPGYFTERRKLPVEQ